ncbi:MULTISPECIES: Fe-S cluster assembly protein SufD [Bacillus cereus group]|uniref:Fe-S cluster assembly protein SufD n=1 Tax=Bacillus cereus group TaxID=86661 RepID=UPI0007FB4CFD|nr:MULTISPECIES: Fe-S cluster assembly protein SufD [Bacillus cereus group]MCP1395570.1 Fe-S cluster assembly protein SufD [Bacillus cereus]OBW86306.1 Fe-S cluster assembly protein SufD [Bacillus cereus]PES49158.1 Fe-S cluster assembly protein SufD [Bacillus thuringiensis]PEV66472.1 Fe-S cluster assembly protein SufD [Bacillus thuringiensis]PFC03715.1 Fe-S cluster assembly protein SufD [Bacillus thuringiensis]
MTIGTLPFDQETIRQRASEVNEAAWLTEFRLQALAQATELPMPTPDKTKIEKWDFIGKGDAAKQEPVSSLTELPEAVKNLIDENNSVLVQRTGTTAFVSLADEAKDKGVIFTDIVTAATEHAELLQKYLMKDGVKVDEHRLTALHAALINGGAFVYVPKNVVLETPLQAVFLVDGEEANVYNHVLFVSDANSTATYVENYVANENAKGIANIVAEVIVEQGAQVKFGAVDLLAKDVTTYVNRRGVVGRDGRIDWALGLMNDGNTISENVTNLMGDGSYADTKTVTIGRGNQTQNFTTKVVHFGKHSEGWILKHGVQKDSATSIFNGIGKIEHGASKSNAQQSSRVLMLDEKARGDANPILLIDEDDVMAGHAASVGRVDPYQLYYLMSRGIPKREAERLVIHGFLAPVVNELPIEGVKAQLVEVIERKVR